MSDWLDNFILATEGLMSPKIFRLWAGISTISGVLQRRVYTELKTGPCYPNLYVMLTGGPGSGKSLAIIETRKLWSIIKGLYVGPDNPTKSALLNRLSDSLRTYKNGSDTTSIFSSLAVPCEEFSVLITKFDIEFLSTLSHIWNNPPIYDAPRTSVESYYIEKPNMTLIAGVTPDTLGQTFPELAWGQGFTSRVMFIYSENQTFDNKDFFRKRKETNKLSTLVSPLQRWFELGGEFEWTEEAMNEHISWLDAGKPPVPNHSRLRNYNERRNEQLVKLSMISAISAKGELVVTLEDYLRARSWLLEAEATMPDVFRAMAQKSDAQIIADMHYYIHARYVTKLPSNREPISDEILVLHLKDRVPSERVGRVIEIAERGGWIRRSKGRDGKLAWIPRPINEVTPTMKVN